MKNFKNIIVIAFIMFSLIGASLELKAYNLDTNDFVILDNLNNDYLDNYSVIYDNQDSDVYITNTLIRLNKYCFYDTGYNNIYGAYADYVEWGFTTFEEMLQYLMIPINYDRENYDYKPYVQSWDNFEVEIDYTAALTLTLNKFMPVLAFSNQPEQQLYIDRLLFISTDNYNYYLLDFDIILDEYDIYNFVLNSIVNLTINAYNISDSEQQYIYYPLGISGNETHNTYFSVHEYLDVTNLEEMDLPQDIPHNIGTELLFQYKSSKDYNSGYIIGHFEGEASGYVKGFDAGKIEGGRNLSLYSFVGNLFLAISDILNLQIGDVYLGYFILIPLILQFIKFVFRLFNGGGGSD